MPGVELERNIPTAEIEDTDEDSEDLNQAKQVQAATLQLPMPRIIPQDNYIDNNVDNDDNGIGFIPVESPQQPLQDNNQPIEIPDNHLHKTILSYKQTIMM